MDLWTIIVTLLFCAALIVYFLSTRNHDYFDKLGIPYIRPMPIFGNMAGLILRTKTFPEVLERTYNLNPEAKYVGFYDFSVPLIMLRDPELIKSVMIKNFDSFPNHRLFFDVQSEPLFQKNLFALKDETWRDMRALLSPAFTSSKMKMMFKIMTDCAVLFSNQLANLDPRPEELNIKDVFGRYTLDVIASTAFGIEVNSMENRNNEFYNMGKSAATFSSYRMLKLFVMRSLPRLSKILNVKFVDDETAQFFTNVIATTISTRDEKGIVRPDMIQLMMQARERKEKSSLSSEDMAAQAFIFLIAGFESPATAMSFAAHELAVNPDVQSKLQAEIDGVLANNCGELSYEDLNSMKYLDAVVNETLRKFPPAAAMDRVASKSFTLPPFLPGEKELRIEAGENIWIPCYSIHRDPKYYPNPEKFDPERFSDENKANINPNAYFPFGLGPRICIANRFALMEVKLLLFHVLSKCNLLPTPKTKRQIKLSRGSFTMMPEGGFWLKVVPR